MLSLTDCLLPDWIAPARVRALMSTRQGGVSAPPFDTLNLRSPVAADLQADLQADLSSAVAENRRRFATALGATPVWLRQVHGAEVVRLTPEVAAAHAPVMSVDASVSSVPGLACTVLVADCLPVLMCSRDGRAVAAAHAGWRGLAAGVLERTVAELCEAGSCAPADVLAWLGACIGPDHFEVGSDVLQAFGVAPQAFDQPGFRFRPRLDGQARWLADLPGLARRRLRQAGVVHLSGGHWCTVADQSRYFSFRRDARVGSGAGGRMAAAIAIVR